MPDLIRDPLYKQIADLLRQEIFEGKYPRQGRFPSERELAARFGISRTTANKVLSMLVADGNLHYRAGIGAFISDQLLDHEMSGLFSFTETARRNGFTPETRVLKFEDARHGELGDTFYLERLRSIDGLPVIFEKRWIVKRVCAGLTQEMASGSLYVALREKLNITIANAEQRARAVIPDSRERALLQIRQSLACLRVEGRGYLAGGDTIWEEDTLFRGDCYEIHGVLSPSGAPKGRNPG